MNVITSSNREDWLNARRTGIGGSDVASVLGLNPWRTPYDLWMDKTGQVPHGEENAAMHFGTILEQVVADEFVLRTGKKIRRDNQMHRTGKDNFQIANLDRVVVGEDAILECKTANAFRSDDWGESQEDEIIANQVVTEHKIPLYYETQIQWYMGVCKKSKAYLAVLIGGQDFRFYCIAFNQTIYASLVEKCQAFWFENVVANVAPKPINIEDVKKLYAKDNGEMLEASNEIATAIGEYKTKASQVKSLKKELDSLQNIICTALGEAQGFLIGGQIAATYKTCQRKAYSVAASSYRKFSVT